MEDKDLKDIKNTNEEETDAKAKSCDGTSCNADAGTGKECGSDCSCEDTCNKPDAADKSEDKENLGESEKPVKKDPKDEKIDELTDKWKRLMAEFENFRKRTDAEKAGMYSEGERTVLEKILPVVDNFERALSTVPEDKKSDSFVDGMEKIYRQFAELLKGFGVEPIDAVGKPFDANLHNAVMHVDDEEKGESEVVEEFQKGYMYKDKVLRYSMVKVAN